MPDITAIGEVLIDLTQFGVKEQGLDCSPPTPAARPPMWRWPLPAWGLCRLWMGKVGTDGFGDSLVSTLERSGVDASCVRRSERATTLGCGHPLLCRGAVLPLFPRR